MSIFREHKTIADRAASDRTRHREKIDKAIKESDFSQYYNDNLTIDTFVQDKDNEVKLVEVRNARAITIPIDNVKLTNNEKTHTINKAMKVGEVQVYFKGIKKQVAEFIPTPKTSK